MVPICLTLSRALSLGAGDRRKPPPRDYQLRGGGGLWGLLGRTLWGIGALLSAQNTQILDGVADTAGHPPVYQPAYFPWYDPTDTFAGLVLRAGPLKPYLRWQYGAPLYEETATAFPPLSQTPYLLRSLPLVKTSKPYTRVRFDQSSRRTQLLSVYHAQYVRSAKQPLEGGLSTAYRRRTREGEYLSETADHYGVGIGGFVRWRELLSLRAETGWNQLQDLFHGGILYDTTRSPWTAFEKQSQRVRISGLRWRRWYRYLRGEAALKLTPTLWLQLEARLTEDRLQSESPSPQIPLSPFWGDSTELRWGIRQKEQTVAVSLHETTRGYLRAGTERLQLDTDTIFLPWELRSFLVEGGLWLGALHLSGRYQWWLQTSSPQARKEASAVWHRGSYELGVAYQSQPLPWIAYQAQFWRANFPPNETRTRFWAAYRLGEGDSTLPPLQLTAWGSLWKPAWLWNAPPRAGDGFWGYGLTLQGGKQGRLVGLLSGLTLQALTPQNPTDLPWTEVLPLLSGWMQVFLRWQLPEKPPVYQLGARISGFTPFRLLGLEPHFATPYWGNFPRQPAYVWLDPYFIVHIRRVMVYLRVEHATEGVLAQGYYLMAWYPMPGRAFSFGVQWDIYN